MRVRRTRAQLLTLGVMLAVVALAVGATSIGLLYRAALEQRRVALLDTVNGEAAVVEAMARYDAAHTSGPPERARAATLSQLSASSEWLAPLAPGSDFTIGERRGDSIWLLAARGDHEEERDVPWASERAAPMRRALTGDTGTMIGLDFRGREVLAAYRPMSTLGVGLVAKAELASIQAPFLRAAAWSLLAAVVLIGAAMVLVRRVSASVVGRLEASERELRQAHKMEAVGQLTGGVAHDFNNLLTVILSGIDSARERNDPSDLDDARDAAARAAELTRQLLALSRQQVLEPHAVDLVEQVQELERLLRRVLDAEIELAVQVPPEPTLAHVDPSQLQQIVINLALNAQDAMPQGGHLTIEVSAAELDDAFAASHPGATAGSYAKLSVLDDGTGMDAKTLEHVFEPFFTTKAPGKGTGLGLSTVYGIVQQSGGFVDVWSKPGQGARFDVYLPPARESAPVLPPPKPATLPPAARDAVILVVDDEPAVRRAHRRTLKAEGFSVLEASSRAEALTVARGAPHIDLVLCDVGLPDGSGVQAAKDLCQEHGALRLLFASGHAADALSRYGIDGRVRFIQKPVGNRELLASVHRALSEQPDNPFSAGRPKA